ncbi:hypothetical protein AB0M57_04700 [Streptomyces sp. NPDC051597]|uniref:hypothetical protein n=1 Tax=Streptomyces sp. NPDC051597 TaxID=3155049 RepID=UPI0034169EEF
MARLQILELPEGSGDERPPFVLVIDQYIPQHYVLGPNSELPRDEFADFAEKIGARAVLAFEETIDIPANDVPLDENGQPLSLKVRIEGDFERLRDQVQEEIEYAQGRITRTLNETRAQQTEDGDSLRIEGRDLPGKVVSRAAELTEIARDMDRLAKWKNNLTDALGTDRTRNWDDIRNAAAELRRKHDAQAEELERLRAGEEPGWNALVESTPGQWIGRWNQASAKERLSMAGQILDGMKRANDCFMADHEAQIARLKAESSGSAEA